MGDNPARTLVDCAILLPFDEALAVADSALRMGLSKEDGRALARHLLIIPAQHRTRVRQVIELLTAARPDRSNPCCAR